MGFFPFMRLINLGVPEVFQVAPPELGGDEISANLEPGQAYFSLFRAEVSSEEIDRVVTASELLGEAFLNPNPVPPLIKSITTETYASADTVTVDVPMDLEATDAMLWFAYYTGGVLGFITNDVSVQDTYNGTGDVATTVAWSGFMAGDAFTPGQTLTTVFDGAPDSVIVHLVLLTGMEGVSISQYTSVASGTTLDLEPSESGVGGLMVVLYGGTSDGLGAPLFTPASGNDEGTSIEGDLGTQIMSTPWTGDATDIDATTDVSTSYVALVVSVSAFIQRAPGKVGFFEVEKDGTDYQLTLVRETDVTFVGFNNGSFFTDDDGESAAAVFLEGATPTPLSLTKGKLYAIGLLIQAYVMFTVPWASSDYFDGDMGQSILPTWLRHDRAIRHSVTGATEFEETYHTDDDDMTILKTGIVWWLGTEVTIDQILEYLND